MPRVYCSWFVAKNRLLRRSTTIPGTESKDKFLLVEHLMSCSEQYPQPESYSKHEFHMARLFLLLLPHCRLRTCAPRAQFIRHNLRVRWGCVWCVRRIWSKTHTGKNILAKHQVTGICLSTFSSIVHLPSWLWMLFSAVDYLLSYLVNDHFYFLILSKNLPSSQWMDTGSFWPWAAH